MKGSCIDLGNRVAPSLTANFCRVNIPPISTILQDIPPMHVFTAEHSSDVFTAEHSTDINSTAEHSSDVFTAGHSSDVFTAEHSTDINSTAEHSSDVFTAGHSSDVFTAEHSSDINSTGPEQPAGSIVGLDLAMIFIHMNTKTSNLHQYVCEILFYEEVEPKNNSLDTFFCLSK